MIRSFLFIACLCLVSCIDTSLSPVTLEFRAEARGESSFEGRDGWQVELTTARLLFGPLYLCPAPQSGDLCDIARAEFLDVATIDALASDSQSLGELAGVSGVTRSAMWEYGRPWPIAAAAVQPLSADSSLHVVGVARRDGEERPFDLRIDIEPARPGVVSVRAAELFNIVLTDEQSVVVETDVEAWFAGVDWSLFGEEDEEQARRALSSALVVSARPTIRIEP